MNTMPHRLADNWRGLTRDSLRTRIGVDKSWTGRSVVSSATNTLVSRAIACTTHRTRLSEMRPVSRAAQHSLYTVRGLETPLPKRRNCHKPQYSSG